jgi:hypothetical protein
MSPRPALGALATVLSALSLAVPANAAQPLAARDPCPACVADFALCGSATARGR